VRPACLPSVDFRAIMYYVTMTTETSNIELF